MGDFSSIWTSFWDVTNPQQAGRWLACLYGAEADTAAAHCALAARGDGREEDYRFWTAVFEDLAEPTSAATARWPVLH